MKSSDHFRLATQQLRTISERLRAQDCPTTKIPSCNLPAPQREIPPHSTRYAVIDTDRAAERDCVRAIEAFDAPDPDLAVTLPDAIPLIKKVGSR